MTRLRGPWSPMLVVLNQMRVWRRYEAALEGREVASELRWEVRRWRTFWVRAALRRRAEGRAS